MAMGEKYTRGGRQISPVRRLRVSIAISATPINPGIVVDAPARNLKRIC
jgi:hypothetical protein